MLAAVILGELETYRGMVVTGATFPRHLVAYDIRNPKRLRRVHRVMQGHGMPLQYSVFAIDLTASERLGLLLDLASVVDQTADCIACIELGATDESKFTFMGPKPEFPRQGANIL